MSRENYGKSLLIRRVKFEDRGNYTCEVSNGVGSPQSYNIELDVMGKIGCLLITIKNNIGVDLKSIFERNLIYSCAIFHYYSKNCGRC